ncbi:MAG: choline dehydrogenase [Candidatus Marinimicrobia bacterium]|nr:choline dehydrogenase [Candidatus Neomarinimicrobiota bacterium]
MTTITADYVIVGAGSAGCVLASRLSENGSNKVVLLEAGPSDHHPMIHIPAGLGHLIMHPKLNWNYTSHPEETSGNRALIWPRGKVIGGSNSINGMLFVRGNATDFDNWSQMGCTGWSYDDVLPFFKKMECYSGGDDAYRGRSGPLPVVDYDTILPATHLFVESAQEAGFLLNKDYNGRVQDGVAYSQMNRRGRFRAATASTYLTKARKRPNLRIETRANATQILTEGKKCTGVTYIQNGITKRINASREVIISSGTVGSPHLLQISGIGPASHLQSKGIKVVHDLTGVGSNLSDHYVSRIVHRVKDMITINELQRGLRRIREIIRFFATGRGALTFGVTSAQVFCKSREGLASPDIQLLFTPASYVVGKFLKFEDHPGVLAAICPTRPSSRGSILAQSPDPFTYPLIRPNYLSDPDDVRVMIAGFKHARRIFGTTTFARYDVAETQPGNQVNTDKEIEHFARTMGSSLYHPVGTCKMGTDPQAVVNTRLQVHGINGLRIVDASVMPQTTTGNTNAPTIMIAEKAAVMMQEDKKSS